MATNLEEAALRLVRTVDGLDVDLGPLQGSWSEQQYLKLSDQTNHPMEFTAGSIEMLTLPTEQHQLMLALLYELLLTFIRPRGGKVLFAPLRLRLHGGTFREPDLLLVLQAAAPRRQNRYWLGADLVVEIVNPDAPERDTITKRHEYADNGIPEYWIVNPLDETINVLALHGEAYTEYGVFQRGMTATSVLLPGFTVRVDDILDAQ
ncbi:MAG: Uma2 family endonuclease [Herpetosiphonaceae bacterium]|nr:Uma2 family endonuclease [Herpetosiphonaceae bacterium]